MYCNSSTPIYTIPIAPLIVTINSNNDNNVPITSATGESVGGVTIPASAIISVNGYPLNITISGTPLTTIVNTGYGNYGSGDLTFIVSPVLDITAISTSPIIFAQPVSISLLVNSTQDQPLCLGYLDLNSKQWLCEDNDVKVQVIGSLLQVSGKTSHFTDFAILRANTNVQSSTVIPTNNIGLITGVAVAAVAVVIIIAAIILGCVLLRLRKLSSEAPEPQSPTPETRRKAEGRE